MNTSTKIRHQSPEFELHYLSRRSEGNRVLPWSTPTVVIPFQNGWRCDGAMLPSLMPTLVSAANPTASYHGPAVGLLDIIHPKATRAILLYGSRAHGTSRKTSDLDILCVADDLVGDTEIVHGKVSVYKLNTNSLLRRAAQGDLFLRYLTYGAQPIFDPTNFLSTIRSTFQPAPTYLPILQQAVDFGTFCTLPNVYARLTSKSAAKILFSVRTVLMAKGYEIFRPNCELGRPDKGDLEYFHDAKYNPPEEGAKLRSRFATFATRHGLAPRLPARADKLSVLSYFRHTSNFPAVRFIETECGSLS